MRYFIHFAYDGTRYHGWQVQPNAVTVQQTLQEALGTLLRQDVEVTGAGRTDTGVHASHSVAHFDLPQETDTDELARRLNRLLPPDIAVQRIECVSDDAHARFSAVRRTYHYWVCTRKDPFRRHYAARVTCPLDFGLMNQAAACLLEVSDFTSFSKLHTDTKTNVCKVYKAEWTQTEEGLWRFEITADRFLRNMVRAIVGTLMEVGRGRLTVADFRQVIGQKNRCAAADSAPANALFLVDIEYT